MSGSPLKVCGQLRHGPFILQATGCQCKALRRNLDSNPLETGTTKDERCLSFKATRRHVGRSLQPVVGGVVGIAFDDVERVGLARAWRAIDETHVREQSVKHNERSLSDFERDEGSERPRCWVVNFKMSPATRGASKARLEAQVMSAGDSPQTAVLACRVFEREPETSDRQRLCVEKRRVLMTGDFA